MTSPARLPIGLIGLGLIGRAHLERALTSNAVEIVAVADPAEASRDQAAAAGLTAYADHRDLLAHPGLGAVIVATPNQTHLAVGLDCVAAGLPTLVEKPIADTVEAAQQLVDAAAAAGVPILVGHQRRHNPLVRKAREIVEAGTLGRIATATVHSTWLKPDAYFDVTWRREPGGGPVLINLIHDIDLLRHLLGEVVSVQSATSNAIRGFEVEDSAAAILRFESGALATVITSDTVASPWIYDLSAGEAAHYPRQPQPVNSHYLAGTEASLALPQLDLWRYEGARGWHEPLSVTRVPYEPGDPYAEQLRHLRAVAVDGVEPLCSGLDGLRTLEVTLAILANA